MELNNGITFCPGEMLHKRRIFHNAPVPAGWLQGCAALASEGGARYGHFGEVIMKKTMLAFAVDKPDCRARLRHFLRL